VVEVVHIGDRWTPVPEEVVADLRFHLGGWETYEVLVELQPGEQVRIAVGPMAGLTAVVQRYLAGSQRAQLLLEFMGRMTSVQLSASKSYRPAVTRSNGRLRQTPLTAERPSNRSDVSTGETRDGEGGVVLACFTFGPSKRIICQHV